MSLIFYYLKNEKNLKSNIDKKILRIVYVSIFHHKIFVKQTRQGDEGSDLKLSHG